MRRTARTSILGVSALSLVLAACSPSSSDTSPDSTSEATAGESTTVTFRLWDEVAKPAYEESFNAFEAKNPDIKVDIELVPWGEYWDQLPLDISSGEMADIYWVNSSNFARYADNGNLIDISAELNADHDEWQQSVVDLYTRNGSLWGVPQLWDSIALFYNKDLVEAAGVDVNNLKWDPSGADDTFLPAVQKLTTDANGNTADSAGFDASDIKTFGFNSQVDLQAIYIDFLGSNGARFQDPETDKFDFNTPEGVEAFQYLVDLINEHKVAPPAAETNTNGDLTRDLFVRGELALYQSGPYNLKNIADNTDINWGIAPMLEGPTGRVGVVHGVVAVGNAETEHKDATLRVLEWMGSAEGQAPIADQGISFPGAVEAQQGFVNYWAERGVDVSQFITAASGDTIAAPFGPEVNAGSNALNPTLLDMFLGSVSVEDGLKAAQDAGNAAME